MTPRLESIGRRARVALAGMAALAATAGHVMATDDVPEPRTTEEYIALARKFVPNNDHLAQMAERYMRLTPDGRATFKERNARTRLIEYNAFALCYYRSVEDGTRADLAAFRCYDRYVRGYVQN